MGRREMALQLTLKILETKKDFGLPQCGLASDEYNERLGEHVAVIFNALIENLKVDGPPG